MSEKARRFDKRKRHTKNSYKSACRGKVRFRTREHAVDAMIGFRYQAQTSRNNGVEARVPIRVYQCPELDCHGGFHLTSKPLKDFAAVRLSVSA